MEQVVEPSNMRRAYKRVLKNRGAAGVDRLTVEELKDWLLVHWSSVKTALLEGRYLPRAVRRVDIPKSNGGVRTLGVPTVVDRLIQQALHQVLQPIFEPTFSGHWDLRIVDMDGDECVLSDVHITSSGSVSISAEDLVGCQ
ncbi:hypothetical protein QU755_21655 [Pseudomonas wenzhouensis]|nr:hypothetical protein [Pseudomonas wenzhouensis]MDM9653984.1 hypothetical protein [Pseudomonas wenzhouensis]